MHPYSYILVVPSLFLSTSRSFFPVPLVSFPVHARQKNIPSTHGCVEFRVFNDHLSVAAQITGPFLHTSVLTLMTVLSWFITGWMIPSTEQLSPFRRRGELLDSL